MPGPKTTTVAAALILSAAILFTTAAAQSPAHSPSPRNLKPAPFAPAPLMMPEPPSMGGGAPSPGLDCMPYLLNLTDCLGYVMTGSNDTKPDPKCCGELGNLVDTQPVCLCQLLANPEKSGFPIDVSKALKLPAVCKVSTPPVSTCAALGYPVVGLGPSAALSPTPSPGSLTVPTVAPSSSESPSAPASASASDGALASSSSPGDMAAENNAASHLFISNLNFFIGLAFIGVLPYFF